MKNIFLGFFAFFLPLLGIEAIYGTHKHRVRKMKKKMNKNKLRLRRKRFIKLRKRKTRVHKKIQKKQKQIIVTSGISPKSQNEIDKTPVIFHQNILHSLDDISMEDKPKEINNNVPVVLRNFSNMELSEKKTYLDKDEKNGYGTMEENITSHDNHVFDLIQNNLQTGWNCFDRACILENILDIKEWDLKNLDGKDRALRIRQKLVEKLLDYKNDENIRHLLALEIVQASQEDSPSMDLPEKLKKIFMGIESFEDKIHEAKKQNIFEIYVKEFYGQEKYAGFSGYGSTSIVDVLAYINPHHRFIIYKKNKNNQLERIHDTNKGSDILENLIKQKNIDEKSQKIHYIYHEGLHFQTLVPKQNKVSFALPL